MASLEKRRFRGDLVAAYSFLRGRAERGASLSSLVTNETMPRNGTKLHQGMLRLDIWKNFFTMRVVKHWSRLPIEVVAPCLS